MMREGGGVAGFFGLGLPLSAWGGVGICADLASSELQEGTAAS